MEEWKDIKGYEGLYQVSNEGRVKSLERIVIKKNRYGKYSQFKHKCKILKPQYDSDGYQIISLCVNGVPKTYKIHRLVAKAFIPNPEDKPEIDHINGVKNENNAENLKWSSHIENTNNTITKTPKNREDQSKKVYQYTLEGKLVAIWPSTRECGRQGFQQSNVQKCCVGENKTYNGYKWSYKPL